jgi:hypothetical protein
MPDDFRDRLNFSSESAYQTAIDALYQMRSLFGASVVTSPKKPPLIEDHLYTLLAALRISAQDLANLRQHTGLHGKAAPVTVANVSALARYAFLAQGLSLTVSDLLTVIALVGLDPFVNKAPTATLTFVQKVQAIQASSVTIAQLNYIYRHEYDPNAGIAPSRAAVRLSLTTLQSGLASIAQADVVVPDPKGALLSKTLGTVLGTALGNSAIGLITGAEVYSVPLAALPSVILPAADPTHRAVIASLYQAGQAGGTAIYSHTLDALTAIDLPSPLIAYDGTAQSLRVTGPMTTAVETTLLALSEDPAYQAAIKNLHQQPIDFIERNLASFLNSTDAAKELIETPAASVADKVHYVALKLMPYVQRVQSVSLIKQTMSGNLSLDPSVCDLLLTKILKSQAPGPGRESAMDDFLALVGDGLEGAYYPTVNFTGNPSKRVDSTIDFNEGFPQRPFSVRWTGWVMPQYSENYVFYGKAGDGIRFFLNEVSVFPSDAWADRTVTEVSSLEISLRAGELYSVELEHYDNTSAGVIALSWSSPSTPKAIVPQTQLFSANKKPLTAIANSYTLLQKVALLVNTLPLTAADVAYLYEHGEDFAGVDSSDPSEANLPFDPNRLPLDPKSFTPAMFDQWLRLNAVATLRNSVPGGDAGLLAIFAEASAQATNTPKPKPEPTPVKPGQPQPVSITVKNKIVSATGWNSDDLQSLLDAFHLSDSDFTNERGTQDTGLVALQACMALAGRLGISAQQLFDWSQFVLYPNNEDALAAAIQNVVKAKYDAATWVSVGKPLNDTIREASKEALIAYILATWKMTAPEGGAITTSDQLYEYFLIDVDMSPCMLTSRIVQASAAVQLFVQRCLLNLESKVSPAAFDTGEWSWLQNFRVWQAARQVLVYPEDWIVPTLRDDKTPLFQDLESSLLQNPITADSVEDAYLTYLAGLDALARLDIRACYWQLAKPISAPDGTPDATNDVLHVFGRTTTQPYTYYYRRLENCKAYGTSAGGAVWTAWEPVTTSIEGDHLVPVVWDGRLYLFWLTFMEQSDPNTQQPLPIPKSGDPFQQMSPQKDLSITLNWSEYRRGAWSSKQSSDPLVITHFFLDKDHPGDLSLITISAKPKSGDALEFTVRALDVLEVGTFEFPRCGSTPVPNVLDKNVIEYLVLPKDSSVYYTSVSDAQTFSVDGVMGLTLAVGTGPTWVMLPTLGKSSSPYVLTFPWQFYPSFGLITSSPYTDQPFFYNDSERAYFVTQSFVAGHNSVANAAIESPLYSRAMLTSSPATAPSMAVFMPSQTALASRVTDIRTAGEQQSNTSSSRTTLSSISFSNFFHPFACTFIKEVNRYGLHPLLTLSNQLRSNDDGVVSGFQLHHSTTNLTPVLTAGVLYAQGTPYMPKAPNPGPAPANRVSYLYYNTKIRFYYNDGLPFIGVTIPNPKKSDDAIIGAVQTDAKSVIHTWTLADWPNGKKFHADYVFETDGPAFVKNYAPVSQTVVDYPHEVVDFTTSGAYSIYNWELFFHIPVLVATQLDQNQQFDDAETYWRYVFNPTTNSKDAIPERYWQFLPFYLSSPSDTIAGQIQEVFYPNLAPLSTEARDQIKAWKDDPFNPFLIARMRPVAFRMYVVMAYIQHHITWADYLFGQNTRESINEATLHYVLAKELLGPQPVTIPERGAVQDYTYYDLANMFGLTGGLDAFSNALVTLENTFPYLTRDSSGSSGKSAALSMSSIVPYFCFPQNDALTSLWSTVEDRLYKIRHCMNIRGVVEQLPLFSPPISPALLVAAAAAGVDISSVLSNTNAATPFYRFTAMLRRTLDLASEVRSLGAALLAALEKQDAEALALLRAMQETSVLQATQTMKAHAVQEASSTLASLRDALALATARQTYYGNLVNNGFTSYENQQLTALQAASVASLLVQEGALLAAAVSDVPNVTAGAEGFGGSPAATATFGGEQLVAAAHAMSAVSQAVASEYSYNANRASVLGQWDRRAQEWNFQLEQATDGITQISDQISAANFHLEFAQDDLNLLTKQIQNAQAVQDFLQGKYTNTELYSWMVDQTSTVFFQCYQMAYDCAVRTESAFRFERGLTTSSYVQFGYWDSLKKGLLSGERLYADL